jgi:hypothetical protein
MLGRWHCGSCGLEHDGIFHLGAPAPWQWPGVEEPEPNDALRMAGDFLSDDLCVIAGEDFFVRGVLEIPVHGSQQSFGFGSWSTLSRENFELYVASMDGTRLDEDAIWTGWFATWPKPFPSPLNQPCWVEPQEGGLRPMIWLEDETHPLARAQRDGITIERLLEIYAANGHRSIGGPKLH